MRTFHWGMQAGFPHSKVFILGILLTLLGSACVVVSVVGSVEMAWGYYVGTGMWGGVTITVLGLAASYAARVRTSVSAKMYLALSVLAIPVSFAMLVLSAGGLTYKSRFYTPVRFDSGRHRVTLILHGSVLGVSVLSLACSILSVIVCLKFISFEKERRTDSFKLRKHRHRFSDPNGVYRTGSLHENSGGGTGRSSTSSRALLIGSDRSQRHSRQSSYSDSGSIRATGERSALRRDSDRSRGSSRSRLSHPTHHRQSSSASQQSRYESLHSRHSSQHGGSDSVYSTLTRENHRCQNSAQYGSNGGVDLHLHPPHAGRTSQDVTVHPVFDSDEEPVPPYEERETCTGHSSNTGDESDIENSDCTVSRTLDESSSSLFGISHLPLNIPVTEVENPNRRARPKNSQLSRGGASYSRSHHLSRTNTTNTSDRDDQTSRLHVAASRHKSGSRPERGCSFQSPTLPVSPGPDAASPGQRSREGREASEVQNASPVLPRNRGSPEICALTGERETPSTLRGSPSSLEPTSHLHSSDGVSSDTSRTLTDGGSSHVSHLNHSSDSSDTSLPEREEGRQKQAAPTGGARPSTTEPHSLVSVPGRRERDTSEEFSSQPAASPEHQTGNAPVSHVPRTWAAPVTLGSPNSAFRPVGRMVPVSQISTELSTPSDRLFSPISAPHAVRSSSLESSSESLSRMSAQSWKMIPLPSSHNHPNRASSVPTKELASKSIPVHDFHSPRAYGHTSDSLSLLGRYAVSSGNTSASSVGDMTSLQGRSPHVRTHAAPSTSQNADSHPLSTLSLRRDRQQAAGQRSMARELERDCRQRDGGGEARQRHTVEVPSLRNRPSVSGCAGGSSNGLRAQWRVERERTDRIANPASSPPHAGVLLSASPTSPSRPSRGEQSEGQARSSLSLPSSQHLQQQQQQQQLHQQAPQQQPHPPPPLQSPRQQAQSQPAQEQSRPLFSVLL